MNSSTREDIRLHVVERSFRSWCNTFGAEGSLFSGVPFTHQIVARYASTEPTRTASAGLLWLAWRYPQFCSADEAYSDQIFQVYNVEHGGVDNRAAPVLSASLPGGQASGVAGDLGILLNQEYTANQERIPQPHCFAVTGRGTLPPDRSA
jgi:hypothetical protein